MKIVLYSGGQLRSNHRLHQAVVKLARLKKPKGKLQLTYFPFCADNASVFYARAIRRYRSHGVERFFCVMADARPTKEEIGEAMESDIIYLAGGNTFYFLKHLRESGLLPKLKHFAKSGGVLAGLSAGGLIMSPTIKLAADRDLGPDPNDVKLKNLEGMSLFDFEFSPHFDETQKQNQAHLAYSLKTENTVFASADGGGMIINGNDYEICGAGAFFHRGRKINFK